MKFPSLSQLWQAFLTVCNRFTIPILYTLIATIAGIALSYSWKDFSTEHMLAKLVYLGNFGLALSLAFCLYAETNLISVTKKLIGNLVILLILIGIYFALQPALRQADVFVLLILGFSFHLLVAFSAFFSENNEAGFWQLNKTFFLRFATSALYSGVLFAGLSIALFSIHTLFNIHWQGEVYLRLWIVTVGLFNTVFFLAGIPIPLNSLNQQSNYPKALKVFTQYVLIPLASIYLLILLAYEVKIIVQWSLPNSSVAILILGYAVFGMLSILLVHPIRNQEGNKWIKLYSKSFYLLMLPLLALLAVAIIKRVADYGITESRYLLIILSLWLSFITAYFLVKGREHIRVVPISLFLFSVLIVFGPWSIKSVSLNSQSGRLKKYLSQKVSSERNDEIRNLVDYLNRNYGSKSLQPFVNIDLRACEDKNNRTAKNKKAEQWETQRAITDTVLATLKISNIAIAQILNSQQRYYVNNETGVFSVKGALQVVEIGSNLINNKGKKLDFSVEGQKLSLTIDSTDNLVLSNAKNERLVFNISDLLINLYKNENFKTDKENSNALSVDKDTLCIQKKFRNYIFKLRLEELNAFYPEKTPLKPQNVYYTGYLIIYPNL